MGQHFLVKFIFFFCLVTLANSGIAVAETPQQIAKETFPSIVLVMMEDANGKALSFGSGFFVRERVIATNFHVIRGASKGYAKVVGQKTKFKIEGHVGLDQKRDLVLLKVSAPKGFVPLIKPLLLGNSNAVEVGEQIYTVGSPQGLEGTFSQGIISSIRNIDSNKLLQITAPISSGSSGGPVLNSKGEVIGVSVATIIEGQNLNFAIPVNYLQILINSIGSVKPLNGIIPSTDMQQDGDSKQNDSYSDVRLKENGYLRIVSHFDSLEVFDSEKNELVFVKDASEAKEKYGYPPIRTLYVKLIFLKYCRASVKKGDFEIFLSKERTNEEVAQRFKKEIDAVLLGKYLPVFDCDYRNKVFVTFYSQNDVELKTIGRFPLAPLIENEYKREILPGETIWTQFVIPENATSWKIWVPK